MTVDARPQIERAMGRALLGAVVLVVAPTILGGLTGLPVAIRLTRRR